MQPQQSSIPTAQPAQAASAADTSQFGDYSDWAKEEMSKGFTADQLQQTLADNKIQVQPSAGAGDNAPWWGKLLPAAGGVLGGILGGAVDVGSLGALAPLINPITGAALGGAAGQAGENLVEGKNPIDTNVLTSGLENAAGQAIGGGVSKIVGALGEGMAGAGTKAIENIATKEAADQATKAAIDDATATKLNFGGISPKLAGDLELGKGQQFVKSMGFDATNPYDMQKTAQGVGDLNAVYDRALQQAKPVDMTDVNSNLFGHSGQTTAMAPGLTQAETDQLIKQGINPKALETAQVKGAGTNVPTAAVREPGATLDPASPMGQAVADFSKVSGVDTSAGLPAQMPATQVRQLQQAIGRQIGNQQTIINNAELNGTYNAEAHSALDKLNEMYSSLGDKIKTPDVNSAIANMTVTDADRQGLVAKYGDKLGNHLADTISNAKTADDLLTPMQDFTKMGRASRMAINDIENVTNSPRAEARAKFAANGGVAVPGAAGASNPTLDTLTAAATATGHPAGAVLKLASKMHEAGLTPKVAQMMGNTLKRTSPLIAPTVVAGANLPGMAGGPTNSAIPSVTGNNQGEATMQPGAGGMPANPVNSTLETILNSLQQPGASLTPGYSSMVQGAMGLAPAVQQNAATANTMAALGPTFQNAGGPQGLAGGLITKLTGMIPGTAANTYEMQQRAAAAQLAKMLGITPEAAMAMMPQFTQTPQTAAPQMQATGGLVSQLTGGLPAQ